MLLELNTDRSKIMPSSSVAQILLRLFALHWFIVGLGQVAGMALALRQEFFSAINVVVSGVYLVAGIVAWVIAPKLSRLLAHRNDGEFNFSGVTEQQMYTAVFLGLGLYFALTSFASAFSWVHFFSVNQSPDYGFHRENKPSYYNMSETVLTFAAGILLVFTCKIWARKLVRQQAGER